MKRTVVAKSMSADWRYVYHMDGYCIFLVADRKKAIKERKKHKNC